MKYVLIACLAIMATTASAQRPNTAVNFDSTVMLGTLCADTIVVSSNTKALITFSRKKVVFYDSATYKMNVGNIPSCNQKDSSYINRDTIGISLMVTKGNWQPLLYLDGYKLNSQVVTIRNGHYSFGKVMSIYLDDNMKVLDPSWTIIERR